ncbi:MAG: hypothetical protein WC402_05505 [Candidatus Pacearchaeota archaeon]|jgi:uncharacterized membrane protein
MKKKKVKANRLSKEVNKNLRTINKSIIRNDFNSELKRFDKDILEIDEELDKDVEAVEKWVVERKKFFIKLGLVILFVLVLFIISELFLTTKVAG